MKLMYELALVQTPGRVCVRTHNAFKRACFLHAILQRSSHSSVLGIKDNHASCRRVSFLEIRSHTPSDYALRRISVVIIKYPMNPPSLKLYLQHTELEQKLLYTSKNPN